MGNAHPTTAQQEAEYPDLDFVCLPEMGIAPQLLQTVREREIEAQLGQVKMNCEMCKFRLAAVDKSGHHHHHHHGHHHHHENSDP